MFDSDRVSTPTRYGVLLAIMHLCVALVALCRPVLLRRDALCNLLD
jgi:hypothetical protein